MPLHEPVRGVPTTQRPSEGKPAESAVPEHHLQSSPGRSAAGKKASQSEVHLPEAPVAHTRPHELKVELGPKRLAGARADGALVQVQADYLEEAGPVLEDVLGEALRRADHAHVVHVDVGSSQLVGADLHHERRPAVAHQHALRDRHVPSRPRVRSQGPLLVRVLGEEERPREPHG